MRKSRALEETKELVLNKQGAGPLPGEGCNEREKTPCPELHLPGDTGGGSIYLGAELGCLITACIMAALNKWSRAEMHFHLHCCWFDPAAL